MVDIYYYDIRRGEKPRPPPNKSKSHAQLYIAANKPFFGIADTFADFKTAALWWVRKGNPPPQDELCSESPFI